MLRKALRALAPHAAVLVYDEWNAIDPDRALIVREAPLDRLRDPRYVEDELLPKLGVAGTIPTAFPDSLQHAVGQGLHPFQWPNQLGPYLATLSAYPISSYLEIGVYRGGTFIATVEYLARFHPVRRAIAVDLTEGLPVRRYIRKHRRGAEYVRTTSGTPAFRDKVKAWAPDLVLIDADHTYDAVRADFGCVDGIAPMVAFHDITDSASPGVARLWGELKESHRDDYAFAEFTEQYPDVNRRWGGSLLGIGLMVRKDFGPPLTS